MNIPVHLCVDVEPNDREVAGDPTADWSATEPCINLLEEFRAKAQAASGGPVHINWFIRLDPQIADAYGRADYAFYRYGPIWDRFQAAGDGIGIHVHAWRKQTGGWLADHGDEKWIVQCVKQSLDVFERCMGRRVTMYRTGDRFLNNALVALLDKAGVAYDLTVEPGLPAAPAMKAGEHATGELPDYSNAPRHPFHPSFFNFQRPGRWFSRRIRLIPVSTGCIGPDMLPVERRGERMHLNLGLNPAWTQPNCDRMLAQPETTHLCWVARTGDFASPELAANIRDNLDYLARLDLRFVRPDEAWG